MAGALMREHPDLHMQTHLSENHAEIAFTQELYPWSRDYTDVYEHYGLLGKRALFGHCIHLSEREADALSDSGSVAVFCPTSNLFLGSGLFDYQRYRTRTKPLQDRGRHRCRRRHQLFHAAHHGRGLQGDRAERREAQPVRLVLADDARQCRGAVDRREGRHAGAGTDADIVVLECRAPRRRWGSGWKRSSTLAEELFLLQTLGDDRAVAEVYVAGKPAKSAIDALP